MITRIFVSEVIVSEVIDLMDAVGLKEFLTVSVGRHAVTILVHPRTFFSLELWPTGTGVSGIFNRQDEETMLHMALKHYLKNGERLPDAQRKARDLLQEFTGGTDGTTQTGD